MKQYKRLTNQKWSEDIDLTQELGYSYIYKRLHELEDKIENGMLVELPCKVGDVVCEVFKNHKPPFIQQTRVEKIIITDKGLRLKLERNAHCIRRSVVGCGYCCNHRDIGSAHFKRINSTE